MATLNETPSIEPVANGSPPAMWRYIGIAAILAIACSLPFVVSGYRASQFSQVLIYAIAMLGLNILTGFNGQISLGQGAFYAIGAYTVAILLDKTAIPYWASVPIAGAICLGAGFLFGLPALRLEGLYLALATLALAVSTAPGVGADAPAPRRPVVYRAAHDRMPEAEPARRIGRPDEVDRQQLVECV